MHNFYDRLKQKKDLVNLPSEITDGYVEDMKEIAEEINEDFVEAIIDKILLEELPKQIESSINRANSPEDLKNITISYRLENLGGRPSMDKKEPYKYYTYPESYSFLDDDLHLIAGPSFSICVNDELRDLFEKQFLDRFSVYTQSNKDSKSGISIDCHNNSRLRYIKHISISGSAEDFINIYYTELQEYNHRKKSKQKQEEYDDKKILDYDDKDFQDFGRVLKK